MVVGIALPTGDANIRPGRIRFTEFGAAVNLKVTHFALLYLLVSAALCAAQSAPQTSDGSQSAQPPATGTIQASEREPLPAEPSAGEPSRPTDKAASEAKDSQDPKDMAKVTSGTSNDRLFFALPNFLTVDKNGKIIPLTAGQKFKVVTRGSFDPVQLPWYSVLAGISQAENSEPGYGQGAEGYGKRLGAYAADGVIENFMVGAVLPSVFHQDPRFFPSGKGSFFHRASYAVSRIVVTRSDSGRPEFNISEVLGSAISSSISTYSYHPRHDRTLGNTASVWVSQMGYDAITITLKEFWPDIRRKLKPH